jgi:ribonuclease HI
MNGFASGKWISGFSKSLGVTTAYVAELWGLFEGLTMTRRLGYKKVDVQMDSTIIVQTINNYSVANASGWGLTRKIRFFLILDWNVKIKHIYREANRGADMLTNIGCFHGIGLLVYHQPPSQLIQVLEVDIKGVSFPHRVVL